jgi:2-polyprenyl-6-methoxyphenol hydroxylase-like FAD-dependent oxidoreductase
VKIGDSCAVIPPFTGHGMAMALIAAEKALDPLVAWAHGRLSWEETSVRIDAALRREFRTRLHGASWLHRGLLGRRGQACIGALARAGLLPMRSLYRILH